MRLLKRLVLATAFALVPAGVAVASCSTNAVGVTACRDIEYERCAVAPICMAGFDTGQCQRFYRDECLVGIQDLEAGADPDTLAGPCVSAIQMVAACVDGGDASAEACQKLIPDASCPELGTPATACNIILNCPEVLSACAFVAAPPPGDGGADADAADAESADGDAADAPTD